MKVRQKNSFKKIIASLLSFLLVLHGTIINIPVYAGGGSTSDGNEITYHVDSISINGEYMDIKGWAYQNNDLFNYHTKGDGNGYHMYKLNINGLIYYDKNDYWIDHTYLNSAVGTQSASYKNVGFHFQVSINDLLDSGNSNFKLQLLIRHQNRSWTSFYLSYMSTIPKTVTDLYTMKFNTDTNPISIYTSFNNLYVRNAPSKSASKIRGSSGKELYFRPFDYFNLKNQSLTGNIQYDSQSNVYWYEVRFVEDAVEGSRQRVKASSSGKAGWICDGHVKYMGNPVQINIERNTYTVAYHGNGGKDVPSTQIKYANKELTLTKNIPSKNGSKFIGWNSYANGKGESYQPASIYCKNENIILYAQWQNEKPVITAPIIIDNNENTNSNVLPYIFNNNLILQVGDILDAKKYYQAHDKEDGDITDKVEVTNNSIPINQDKVMIEAGTYTVDLKVSDSGGQTSTAKMEVIVNEAPIIDGEERWFLQNQTVDKKELLLKVKAHDKEDGDISNKVEIEDITYHDGKKVQNPSIFDTTFNKDTADDVKTNISKIKYSVMDSYKRKTIVEVNLNVARDSENHILKRKQYIRYIDKNNIKTLDNSSIWKIEENYNQLFASLQKTSDKQAKAIYQYLPKEIKEIKNWIRGTTLSPHSNQEFINKHLNTHKTSGSLE